MQQYPSYKFRKAFQTLQKLQDSHEGTSAVLPYPGKPIQQKVVLIKGYLKNSVGLRILDQGCGKGYEIVNLNECLPGNEFLGIDISPKRCREAKVSIEESHVANASFIVGDGARLPLVSNPVNLAISNQVIEHVQDQDCYVREGYRVLRKGALYLITTGNRLFPWEGHLSLPLIPWLPKRVAVFMLRLRYADWRRDFYESVYPISMLTVERILGSAGFSLVDNTSLMMMQKEMIATIPSGPTRILLEKASAILERVFRIPVFGAALQRVLSALFPYVAFTCIG